MVHLAISYQIQSRNPLKTLHLFSIKKHFQHHTSQDYFLMIIISLNRYPGIVWLRYCSSLQQSVLSCFQDLHTYLILIHLALDPGLVLAIAMQPLGYIDILADTHLMMLMNSLIHNNILDQENQFFEPFAFSILTIIFHLLLMYLS